MISQTLSPAENRLRRRAQQYIDGEQLVAAQATLETLVQRVPADAPVRMELARVLLWRSLPQAATAQLLQAVDMLPREPALIIQLVRQLLHCGEVLAARACLDHLVRLPPPEASVLATQAHLRWMVGEIDVARTLMDRAIAAGIDTPNEHHTHAMLYQFSGDVSRAEQILETCLCRRPLFGTAVMSLANMRRQTPESNHLEFLFEQLQRMPKKASGPGDQLTRAQFEAAVFKELDDLGRFDEAWPALERSKAIMRTLNPYDASGEVALIDALISQSEAIYANPGAAVAETDGPTPIFIVGMPRSGTTLLDRMLSSHSAVVSAGEINDFVRQLHWVANVAPGGIEAMLRVIHRSPEIDFAELGARYLKQTQWRAGGHRFYIDKLPVNVQMVPFIRRALPHAPILHMVREPMEVCFSNFRAMFGDISAYSNDMHAVARHYGQYVRLTNHWHTTMPGAMLDVSYEALVREPDATLLRVLKHCGLEFEASCLRPERNAAPVATPSSAQVRESIHTCGLAQSQHYARHLEPLRLALAGSLQPARVQP
jgi:tetratricopeptide (TPR) repeat protein